MANPTAYQRRLAIRDKIEQLLFLVGIVLANPTQAAVDAVITAAADAQPLVPKPDYSLDGESYSWGAYHTSLLQALRVIDEAIQRARPFMYLTQMRS